MKRIPRVSETEWQIMDLIWAKGAASAHELIKALKAKDPSWHPRTVKTYLARLLNKRALDFHKEGRAYIYSPLVSKQECVDAASESFLDRVFGGSLRPMLAHFVAHKKLSAKEIQDLRKLLDEEQEV
jgi:BlaI family penicillinase repressor